MKITKTQQKTLNKKLFELDLTSPSLAIEIEKLLDEGADVNASNTDAYTLLHKMANTGNLAAAELLLNKGSDPLKENGSGLLALHLAAFHGHASVVECLLKYKTSEQLLHEDKYGVLSLYSAAYRGHKSLVESLLKYNPSEQLLHKSKEGFTAVDSAARNGKASVIEVFLNHLPIDQHPEIYQSALETAKKNNHAHCIALIEQALLQNAVNNSLSNINLSQEKTVIAIKNRNRL